jgi:hypothetical protein
MLASDRGKSLSNLAEPIVYISPGIGVAALVRLVIGHSRWTTAFAWVLLSSFCVAAFSVYWFTPGWPE